MENNHTNPPSAQKINKELVMHEDIRIDPYYWLNDREDPKVIEYLKAENAYVNAGMKHTEELQEKLFEEIKGRIKKDDHSVPYKKNGYWYYVRYEQGQEYPIYCRKRDTLENPEEILIDANVEARNFDYYSVGGISISPDNKLMAYAEDTLSRRLYTIRIKKLETGEMLPEKMEDTSGDLAWASDNRTLFYTTKDETLRPSKIFRHRLGEQPTEDALVFEESDSSFTTGVFRTKSGRFIVIHSGSTISDEYRYLSSDDAMGSFRIFQKREADLEYSISHYDNHWYVRSNANGAVNFKLDKTPVEATEKENWKNVVPHREEVFFEGFETLKSHLVIEERERGLTSIRVMAWEGDEDYKIPFDEETYMAWIGHNPDFESTELRYGYSSLTTPSSVFDFDLKTRTSKLKKQTEVVGGYEKEDYQSRRIWIKGHDGKEIPVSLVYKKDKLNSSGNPLLLYGYGSYGITVDPGFSSARLSLLDRGFIYAIAHIRGGQYLGRKWYEDGKMLRKKNTFHDFISCAEQLQKTENLGDKRLHIMGGSAGGLLVGAVINERPDLFSGAIAAVPFVDVVTTMLDESIPLTTGEYDEWGNPNDKEYYNYIKSYSPYDNVKAQNYPPLLITTGLHDSQVQYWEPAKWVARLRELKTDSNPLYMHTNMEAGHGGASGRFEAFRETAMQYAFLLDLEGIHE